MVMSKIMGGPGADLAPDLMRGEPGGGPAPSKWYSKRPQVEAKPSTFHERQLAKNKPGQRSQVRKIQEDVLRESEEKRSRYRMGYDD